ncbi:hypothetical protein J3R30DRAFT_3709781 [Lentinula aciculospora]|uniref:Zn(2)-C6 fungal-type domain-containing protein n=1 Tax=Lentinula aciculospora TaxID=153920 RepID=A0A9W9DJN9_9AGAR|nr:hypothetical protein J3R30DRAFT_3709781 [Lentinula aciculospora]
MDASEIQADFNRKRPYRGKACGNCRVRKIKCDGTRPSCLQCLRRPGRPNVADCQYPNPGPSESQNLEADIRNKEALLKELEEPTLDDTAVKLSLPYSKEHVDQAGATLSPLCLNNLLTKITLYISVEVSSNSLIDDFLNFATEFGFFVHIPRFRLTALLPEAHSNRPHKGLLCVVELLEYHLRREQNKKSHDDQEQIYLSSALLHQPNIITSSHPNKVIHAIQSEVLLGMYFYHASRPLTAKYHLNAALAMAMAAGTHKIQNFDATSLFQYPTGKDIDEEGHRITEGEKLNGFWVTLSLNISLAIALRSPVDELLLLQSQLCNNGIDTPWPMDIQSYATNILIPVGHSTVDAFFDQHPSGVFEGMGEPDVFGMYVRSSMLLGRAYIVIESLSSNRDIEQENAGRQWQTSISLIDKLIDSFRSTLIPFDQSGLPSNDPVMVFATHIMTNSATILLCDRPLTASSPYTIQKRLWAAESCAQLVCQFNQKCKGRYLNPTLIPLLALIARAIIDEILLRDKMAQDSGPSEELPQHRRKELKKEIHMIFDLMKANEKEAPSALAG